jgi:hypothetical protein
VLTIKENLRETLKGGKPERFVNQFSFMGLMFDPVLTESTCFLKPGEEKYNGWGVKIRYQYGTPGSFPVCTGEDKLLKEVTNWKNIIKSPRTKFSDEEWGPCLTAAKTINRNELFATALVGPGIFEKLHYFMGMEDTMINFYEEPEAMHELIDFLTEWEIEGAKEVINHLHPEALFHTDDWGSQKSLFLSPDMFEEFIEPAYRKLYGFWKDNGVEIIVHHSDCYAATLVPNMIRMGVDIFQGAVYDNNIPELIKQYGGRISIMAGLDNGKYDTADWSVKKIHDGLEELFKTAGAKYLIPGLTMGDPKSSYPGVYEAVTAEIENFNRIYFE